MRTRLRESRLILALTLLFCLLIPSEARADGIDLGILMAAGAVVLVPLLAFNVLLEALVIRFGLRVTYRKALRPALAANVASLFAGIPVVFFNAWMYSAILPRDLAPYFRAWPSAAVLGTAVYFAVTLVTEYAVILRWCRRTAVPAAAGRVALVVLLANAATYAVLAPLHYAMTRPINDIREFTDAADWAARPTTLIYYVDVPSGHLCSIASDGAGRRELVADEVKSYQLMPDSDLVLYLNGSGELRLAKAGSADSTLCLKPNERFIMDRAAASPDGKCVAWLREDPERKTHRLELFDTSSRRGVATDATTVPPAADEDDLQIAWSTSPSVLFLRHGAFVRAVRIEPDLSTTVRDREDTDEPMATVYGRFGSGGWWGGDEWGPFFRKDESGTTAVLSDPGLVSHIRVTRHGGAFYLADNPGVLKLARRQFGEVCLLPNGKELIFDDCQAIYLMDLDKRVVGKITDGCRFVIPTPRYQRKR